MAGTALHGRLTWQTAAVTSVTRETSSVCTIGLDLPDWPGHRAGQRVDVRLTAEDGCTAEREYSIASAPGEPLAITVERLKGGEVSPYLTEELHAGDELELRGPVGGYLIGSAIAGLGIGFTRRGSRRTPTGSPAHPRRRSATSAAGSVHHARHEPTPTTIPYRQTFLKGFEHASDHRTGS